MVQSSLPSSWKLPSIGEVCLVNPSKSETKGLPPELEVSFVPMAAVSEKNGQIFASEVRQLKEVRKGYTYFKENDILLAKITPSMENGKIAIARKLQNGIGFGSTEFHVLRAFEEVIPEWVYYFLRQKSFRMIAKTHMTGTAGQQRVPESFVMNTKIPKPDIDLQRKIVNKLDEIIPRIEEAERIRDNAMQEIELLRVMLLEKLLSGRETQGWRTRKLRDVIELSSGDGLKSAELNDDYPYTVYGGNGIAGNYKDYMFDDEKIVIGRVGSKCGNVHVTLPKSWITDNALLVSKFLEDVERDFLVLQLRRLDLRKFAKQAAQPVISQTTILGLEIGIPSKEVQQDVVNRFRELTLRIESISQSIAYLDTSLNNLTSSILHKAFTGQLVDCP